MRICVEQRWRSAYRWWISVGWNASTCPLPSLLPCGDLFPRSSKRWRLEHDVDRDVKTAQRLMLLYLAASQKRSSPTKRRHWRLPSASEEYRAWHHAGGFFLTSHTTSETEMYCVSFVFLRVNAGPKASNTVPCSSIRNGIKSNVICILMSDEFC